MRSPDGRIFDISTEARSVEPTQEEARDREEEERQNRLDELYTQARRAYRDRQWQAVVAIFDQIHTLNPDYPDPEGLLVSAREELAAWEHERTVAALYDQGRRHVEAEEWEQALECFEEVQRLEPGYRRTETLLSQVRQGLAKPPTVEVPDLSGQSASQARRSLENRGLKLGTRKEAPSDAIAEGEIVGQIPEAGTKAKQGSSVSITLSSGPKKKATTTVPDISGRSLEEDGRALSSAGLVLGNSRTQKSGKRAGTVISTDPSVRSEVDVGTSVSPIVSRGPRRPPAKNEQSTQSLPPQTTPPSTSPARDGDRGKHRTKRPRWAIVATIFAALAAVVVRSVAFYSLSDSSSRGATSSSNDATGPDLRGESLSQAYQTATAAGYSIHLEGRNNNTPVEASEQPKGTIIDQKGGSKVINVALSGGQGKVEVPDVSGMELDRAAKVLIDSGLGADVNVAVRENGKIIVYDWRGETDPSRAKVAAIDPAAGTEVDAGTEIEIR